MKFAQKLSAVAGLAIAAAAFATPQETINVGTLDSNGPLGNAVNGVFNYNSAGGYTLRKISYSGGLTQVNTGTFLTEARLLLTPPGGNPTTLFQPFTTGTTWTGTRAAAGSTILSSVYDPAGTWEIRAYETFDDGGTASIDARWSNLQFVFDNEGIVPPSGTGTYTPNTGVLGTNTVAAVTVTPGTNPVASVTLNASLLGAGSVTLRDNGVPPDAVAGDNIWSANVLVSSGSGATSTPFTMLDTVGTSGSGSMSFNVVPPPPANDDCGTAQTAIIGSNPFNNTSATNDGLVVCVGSAKDVWFKYTAPNSNDIIVNTCTGTTQDTVLAVFDACGGTRIACNDDSCGLQSSLTLTGVTSGATYYIRVAGYGATPAGGAGVLTLSQVVPPPPVQWDENANGGGDAGDARATAQSPTGTDPFLALTGSFTASDVDIYRISICDASNFSASLVNNVTNGQDTQMFLFDANGAGVQMNDDTPAGIGESAFGNQFVTQNGIYYIAVTKWDRDPVNASGAEIWADQPFGTVRSPDGTLNGGDITLASWAGTYATGGNYRLDMTGVCFAPPAGCAADYNGDTVVDFFDYLDFVADFSSNAPNSDFNGDTVIDFFDYLDFVAAFSEGC
jgi:hypothetical protein